MPVRNRFHEQVARYAARHLPRRTVRLRLTLTYGGLFLASGAGLLAITYALVVHATNTVTFTTSDGRTTLVFSSNGTPPPGKPDLPMTPGIAGLTPDQAEAQRTQLYQQAQEQHTAVLHQLLAMSGIALALMALISIALGWVIAGRVLSKLRTITTRVQSISATNLHDRLALDGPDDELKELGDTFDALLGRLDAAFQAQRRFVANASHELRTPLTRQRVLAQVALADPHATLESLRNAHERVLVSGAQQESLINALLTLARGQVGLNRYETFDLAELADEVVSTRRSTAAERRLDVDARMRTAPIAGNRQLTRQLITNLLDNAIRHNTSPGWIEISTSAQAGRAIVTVTNSGPIIPPGEVERLFEPFHRLGTDRTQRAQHALGHGLGLSIVQAIATTHNASIAAHAPPRGGLHIEVAFPALAREYHRRPNPHTQHEMPAGQH